jgi:hypothetical protein
VPFGSPRQPFFGHAGPDHLLYSETGSFGLMFRNGISIPDKQSTISPMELMRTFKYRELHLLAGKWGHLCPESPRPKIICVNLSFLDLNASWGDRKALPWIGSSVGSHSDRW